MSIPNAFHIIEGMDEVMFGRPELLFGVKMKPGYTGNGWLSAFSSFSFLPLSELDWILMTK